MYFKSGEKACTGLNLKAISEGTGKVVKRVGVWGNPKAISGDMGKDFRNMNLRNSNKALEKK
jgi:hypothetical protein